MLGPVSRQPTQLQTDFYSAASIWFEIWGSWIRVKKILFSRQIHQIFRFFSRQIFTKFRFSVQKFPNDLFSHLLLNFRLSRQISHLQLLFWENDLISLIFSSTRQFRTYFLYMIR